MQGHSYDLTSLSLSELQSIMEQLGEMPYRARQIFRWLYQKRVSSINEMTDLSLAFRQKLSAGGYYVGALKMLQEQLSASDATRKYLFELTDGNTIESVSLTEDSRDTLCFSTQAGCAMGCTFCATGQSGFVRNLSAGEIIGQALGVLRSAAGRRLTNAVAMGQGEPLANYDETLKALRIFNAADGFAIGARHLTLSTCGLVEGIRRLAQEPEQFGLAVSLHSAIDAKRAQLMPKAAKASLAVLKAACVEYTNKTGRRITLEYTMIASENDNDADLRALIRFCRGWLCHVNLIPLNPVTALAFKYDRSVPSRVMKFGKELEQAGIAMSIRKEKGADLDAACGQLRQRQVHEP